MTAVARRGGRRRSEGLYIHAVLRLPLLFSRFSLKVHKIRRHSPCINETQRRGMLQDLLVDLKVDKFCNRHLESTAIEYACGEIDVGLLEDILRKYTRAEDMFLQPCLHGTNENIKIMVDMGKALETPDTAWDVYDKINESEPLYYRCLVGAFKVWVRKTEKRSSGEAIAAGGKEVCITDLKEQLNVPCEAPV